MICMAAMLQVTIYILGVALSLFITSTNYELKIDYAQIQECCTVYTINFAKHHLDTYVHH